MSTEVARVMRRLLVGVDPFTPAPEAEKVAVAQGVEHLLVLDCDDLVGVASVSDLHRAGSHATVSDCMSVPLRTVSASASLEEAAAIMRESELFCLPVVAGGLILGLVTLDQLRLTTH
jgi:CBS domain-containing protein